jgi:hypothetical protein
MASAAIAIRVREMTEETLLSTVGKNTKQCSGCDPDKPGHVPQALCKRCKGTGRERFSFLSVLTELQEPTKEAQHGDDDIYVES